MSVAISLGEVPAFANRDDLIREVKDELDRDDVTDLQVRSAIQLLEAYLNRNLRVPQMETVDSLALTDGSGPLPSDFVALRAMYDSSNVAIPAVDPVAWIETQTGARKVCAIVGNAFKVAPASNETITFVYYAKIPNLTADAQTNWLLESHPDVYFYGVLMFLTSRLGDTDSGQIEKWKAALDMAVAELDAYGKRRRFGGPLMQRSVVTQVRGALA